MTENPVVAELDLRTASSEAIREVIERAAVDAVERHRQADVPVAVWDYDQQRVVLLDADDALVAREPLAVPR